MKSDHGGSERGREEERRSKEETQREDKMSALYRKGLLEDGKPNNPLAGKFRAESGM